MPYKDKEYAKKKASENYYKNKDAKKSTTQAYYFANREKKLEYARESALKRKYNLDNEQYLQMLLDQNNVCAICNKAETRKDRVGDVKPLSVDHSHATGLVRGLLCNDCNFVLGFCKEDISILEKTKTYLQKYSKEK